MPNVDLAMLEVCSDGGLWLAGSGEDGSGEVKRLVLLIDNQHVVKSVWGLKANWKSPDDIWLRRSYRAANDDVWFVGNTYTAASGILFNQHYLSNDAADIFDIWDSSQFSFVSGSHSLSQSDQSLTTRTLGTSGFILNPTIEQLDMTALLG